MTQKKKNLNNDTLIQNLDNPHMNSSKTFRIPLPSHEFQNNAEIISFYEKNIRVDVDWKSINVEQIFSLNQSINAKFKYAYISDDECSEEEEENEKVTRENISKFEPFKDHSNVLSFITEANNEYSLIEEETGNHDILLFKCKSKSCNYKVVFMKNDDGFHIVSQTNHSCSSPKIISKDSLKQVVKKLGKQIKVDKDYYRLVYNELKTDQEHLNIQRIRRAYNDVYDLNKNKRLKTWGKLESFLEIIKESGGYGQIHKNENGFIDFVGFSPNYSVMFMHSILFFPVIQMDTRFQTGISAGHLYCIITLTGNRTIVPIAAAWAPTENKIYTKMLLNMLANEIGIIKVCQTDESGALISPIEEAGIQKINCAFGMHLAIVLISLSLCH